MQDQTSRDEVGWELDGVERVVLPLLLDRESPGPWSVKELARQIGSELRVAAVLVSSHAAGLVHRCQGFVWATRAAARFSQLTGGP
jgi:hypothetical protein